MSLVRVGCELHYQVINPSSFLFHVTAASTPHQTVHREEIRVEPAKPYDICYLGAEDNRVFRLQAMAGARIRPESLITIVVGPPVP